MLRRKVEKQLSDWKNRSGHKSLIISGARQIGKTYSVERFGRDEYKTFIELNFLENPEYKTVFDGSLNVDDMALAIAAVTGGEFSSGDTLLLFDEIQECPRAIQSLKFWTQDGRYDVIGTGSALGMSYKADISYPVGNVEYLDMYPLDFEEFLWANGVTDEVIDSLRTCFEDKKAVHPAIHTKIMSLLRLYMVLGGMPEVIETYKADKNLAQADAVQRRIYRDYIGDIAHFAPANIRIKAQNCYRSIAGQLTKDNHKFQYSFIEHRATATKFETSVDWLNASFVTQPIISLKRVEYPLKAYSDDSNFRIYNTDIGLLMAAFDFSLKSAILNDGDMEEKSSNIMLGTAKGGLFEALAADMLVKSGHKDIYFYKDAKSTSEIEFVIEGSDGAIPIEIKAGRKRANSLAGILQDDRIAYGYKMSSQNTGVSGKLITMPLYMLMFL